ncbi:putative membrane protein YeaQ/YmgE (transglycosylase-associated protein family) [Actinoplanes campanulatus]|uniref:Putative membrane protein YeaQ/YmgE (Transglycosylase-associated protein family) n=1 Tax=Actinoplanes campanulatus TaxID=113559 RepID=A0A7W5AQD6_9ACTN|nr:GlsB/YeaQ/YmgE family stress response membrane protein [Actinoplanes campanulatus]MBB3100340.1 putative membrane protein YeaQ/YmgE (transglycosylase-associated protein family) [Actinoplanes campanulatus]
MFLGFIAGVIARVLMPGDAFRKMSGPASWLVSVGLGLAGAMVGYVIFTLGFGIGDDDIFDWGGILSAIIGTLIVIPIAGWLLRRWGRAS